MQRERTDSAPIVSWVDRDARGLGDHRAPTGRAPTSPSPNASVGDAAGSIVYLGPVDGGSGIRIVGTDGTGDHWLFPDVKIPKDGWRRTRTGARTGHDLRSPRMIRRTPRG